MYGARAPDPTKPLQPGERVLEAIEHLIERRGET